MCSDISDDPSSADYDDDDIPWADPQIRKDYEAALGRLILAHNDVDRFLTMLIECILRDLGDQKELEKLTLGLFARRLDNLRMLKGIRPELRLDGVDLDELEELNRLRNIVAHGHFEQNPFQGDYELISNNKTHKEFSVERLNEITKRLDDAGDQIKPQVYFWDMEVEPSEPERG
jgi:uncharacterized protein YutE (UPF0331/DUF86 family)